MREHRITTERGTVCYWSSDAWEPSRRTLVFLHGLTGDHTMFQAQYKCFCEEYNILLWDAPAHGRSRPYQGFTYPDAAEVLKGILECHQVGAAVMVGQSMGGFVIQSFLKRYPSMVSAFVSIDSTPYGEGYYSNSDRWWLRQIEWMSRLFPLGVLKKAVANQVSVTRESREGMLRMLEPYGKRELCHLMGIGFAGFLEDCGELEIPCPVLLLLGEKDVTGKVRIYNRRWAEKTGYPLEIIPNAAHNANVDNPEAVNRAIRSFMERLTC